jgi:hypothetical protein
MLLGIPNAPTLFQNLINNIFNDIIDLSVITYINNILIYRQLKMEHKKLIKELASHFQKYNLATSNNKSEFHNSEIEFVGYLISEMGINIAEVKL